MESLKDFNHNRPVTTSKPSTPKKFLIEKVTSKRETNTHTTAHNLLQVQKHQRLGPTYRYRRKTSSRFQESDKQDRGNSRRERI